MIPDELCAEACGGKGAGFDAAAWGVVAEVGTVSSWFIRLLISGVEFSGGVSGWIIRSPRLAGLAVEKGAVGCGIAGGGDAGVLATCARGEAGASWFDRVSDWG